jgi:hypothetical protein
MILLRADSLGVPGTLKRKAEAFVDNTDLWVKATTLDPVNTEAPLTPASILLGLTTLIQFWYRPSGGALGFHKDLEGRQGPLHDRRRIPR